MAPKIALTIHALHGGGAERLMSQLAARWAAMEYEIHLITWADSASDRYAVPPTVRRHGLNLQAPSKSVVHGMLANFKRVRRLRSLLSEISPDIVLSFTDQMNIATLQAAKPLRIPVWISEHSDPEKQRLSPLWETWRKKSYPRCAGCHALTAGIADYMARWIPRKKIHIIPAAIQTPQVSPHSDDSFPVGKGRTQDASQEVVVLSMGRLSNEKGVDVLLEGWRQLDLGVLRARLMIAGDGPQRDRLLRQADGLKCVEFVGWTEDPWPLYQRADVFVLPSRYEGFPVALLEAMSQGVACITTQCSSAIDELFSRSNCLEVVPPESPGQLAVALQQLCKSAALRGQLGQRAQEVARNYHWDQIGPRWDALLKQAFSERDQC